MLRSGFPTAGCNGLGWIRHFIRLVSKRRGSSLRRLEEEQARWQYYNQSKAAGHRQMVPIREVQYGYRWRHSRQMERRHWPFLHRGRWPGNGHLRNGSGSRSLGWVWPDLGWRGRGSGSVITQSCPTLCDPTDCGPPVSSVHGILQARIWSGLPVPSLKDLPDAGIEPGSPALQADSLPSELQGRSRVEGEGGIKSTNSSVTESAIKERHLLQIRHNPLPAEHVLKEWRFWWCQQAFFGGHLQMNFGSMCVD